jgi:RNA recognition motif-containing protein
MNIFVSQLSYGVNDADLNELFAEYGTVNSAKVIVDRETGRSGGFGFVEMADAEGQKAIDELNGAEYDGKIISVSVARLKTENRSGGGNRDSGYGNRRSYLHSGYVFVKVLPPGGTFFALFFASFIRTKILLN